MTKKILGSLMLSCLALGSCNNTTNSVSQEVATASSTNIEQVNSDLEVSTIEDENLSIEEESYQINDSSSIEESFDSNLLVIDDAKRLEYHDYVDNLTASDVDYIEHSYSALSSIVDISTNKSLIRYLLKLIKKLEISEVLYPENHISGDEGYLFLFIGDRMMSVDLASSQCIYIKLYDINEKTNIWQYKCIEPDSDIYTSIKSLSNKLWLQYPSYVIQYLDCELDEKTQDKIIKTFINERSPIEEYYEHGWTFTGLIEKYYGKYNNYYAVFIDGCGIGYDEALATITIDGVSFNYFNGNRIVLVNEVEVISLEDGFDRKIITHEDLVSIATIQNGK